MIVVMASQHDVMTVAGKRWRITEPTFTDSFRIWVGILARVGRELTTRAIDALIMSDPGTLERLAHEREQEDEGRREARALEVIRQVSLGRRLSQLVITRLADEQVVQDPLWVVLRWLAPGLTGVDARRLAAEVTDMFWDCRLTLADPDPEGEGSLWKLREAGQREAWEAALADLRLQNSTKARLGVWCFLVASLPPSTVQGTPP